MTDLRPRPAFAHASEAELARILDFYEVAWAYEPHTFPILFDGDGAVLESFSPDFYLPELDLYVELTTLRQSLVRKKNRKLRRLRELYPAIRIKLLYARDFRALLLKYGRIALADGLSGAEGQATPPRRGRERLGVAAGPPRVTGASSSVPAAPAAATTPAADPARAGARDAVAGVAGRSRRARRSRAEARARALATSTTTTAGTELTA